MPDEKNQQDATTPKQGGFGAFSQQYRDRWAANHPNARTAGADGTAAPDAPAADVPPSDAPPPDSATPS